MRMEENWGRKKGKEAEGERKREGIKGKKPTEKCEKEMKYRIF